MNVLLLILSILCDVHAGDWRTNVSGAMGFVGRHANRAASGAYSSFKYMGDLASKGIKTNKSDAPSTSASNVKKSWKGPSINFTPPSVKMDVKVHTEPKPAGFEKFTLAQKALWYAGLDVMSTSAYIAKNKAKK